MGQSTYALPAHYREDQFTIDVDQVLNQKNTLSGRLFWSRAPTIEPFSPNAANVPGWGTNKLNRNTMFVLADTHVFSAKLVNNARFGYVRFDGFSTLQNPITAASIGEGTPTGATGASLNAPGLTVGGFTIGDAGTPSLWQVTNSFVLQDTLALTRGRHNMRFGGEVKRHQVDEDAPEETDGLVQIGSFDDFLVGQSATQNGSPFGLSNLGTSQAGAGNFPKRRAVYRLCRLCAGRFETHSTSDDQCRSALRDIRRANRDQWTAGKLRSEYRRDRCAPRGGHLQWLHSSVKLCRYPAVGRLQDLLCGLV